VHERSWIAAGNAAVAVAVTAVLAAFALTDEGPRSTPIVFVEAIDPDPPSPADLPPPADDESVAEARLVFAGDLMQHAAQADDDFDASYSRVAPLLRAADLAAGNLEFPVLPSRPPGPEAGTVAFNGSPANLDAIARAGFTLLSTSNNHAFDQGMEGVVSTLDEIEARGMVAVGTARTRRELEREMPLVDVRGIRVAFVAYTFTINTYGGDDGRHVDPLADFPAWSANFAEWEDEYRERGAAMFRDHVARARGAGADFVVALPHWGEEWNFNATPDQRAAARDLTGAGFDLVVGGHGHVIAAPELVGGRLVAYSLGNFVCDFPDWRTRTGALLEVTLRKDSGGRTRLKDFAFRPLLVRRQGHVVEPLDGSADDDEAQRAWELSSKLFGKGLAGPRRSPSGDGEGSAQ
jgi:poly-gamma-glutamate capsule biosynthesis protein CapA/YwtB (metallophosphatase superfamily)